MKSKGRATARALLHEWALYLKEPKKSHRTWNMETKKNQTMGMQNVEAATENSLVASQEIKKNYYKILQFIF
jgi:hypothetical protein